LNLRANKSFDKVKKFPAEYFAVELQVFESFFANSYKFLQHLFFFNFHM